MKLFILFFVTVLTFSLNTNAADSEQLPPQEASVVREALTGELENNKFDCEAQGSYRMENLLDFLTSDSNVYVMPTQPIIRIEENSKYGEQLLEVRTSDDLKKIVSLTYKYTLLTYKRHNEGTLLEPRMVTVVTRTLAEVFNCSAGLN